MTDSRTLSLTIAMTLISCQSNQEKETQQLAHGREVYIANCISCHREEGEGVPGFYPSLRKNDAIIEAQTTRAIRLIKYGSGYDNGMKPVSLSSQEITAVINYIQNSWTNNAPFISQSQVEAITN